MHLHPGEIPGRFVKILKFTFFSPVYRKLRRVVQGLFVLRPLADSTPSRSSISGLSTKGLTSTLKDTGCLKTIVFRVRGLVGDILLTK
jgi:hypothetical protein